MAYFVMVVVWEELGGGVFFNEGAPVALLYENLCPSTLYSCWVLASSLAPRKVPGRYPGAGSLPGGHCVVVMRGMSPF